MRISNKLREYKEQVFGQVTSKSMPIKQEIFTLPKQPKKPEMGDVYMVATTTFPIWLLVLKVEKKALLVPISPEVEFAGKNDVLFFMKHPLRSEWIAELDLAFQAEPDKLKFHFELNVEKVARRLLGYLKSERKPKLWEVGEDSRETEEFKRIEMLRLSMLKKILSSSEEGVKVIRLPKDFSTQQSLSLAAASEESIIDRGFFRIFLYPQEKVIEIEVNDELKGRRIILKWGRHTLYRGKCHRIFRIENVKDVGLATEVDIVLDPQRGKKGKN